MKATGDLCNNFTSSVSDTRRGRGFRAFLNSPIGRAYFDNNKEEERKTMEEMSKSIKRCFLVMLLW